MLAFAFNGIGVPAATTGLISPVSAMVAMISSDTAVLANSFGGQLLGGESVTGGFGELGHDNQHPAPDSCLLKQPRQQCSGSRPAMHCEGCSERIQSAFRRLDGVVEAHADPDSGIVGFSHRRDVFESQIRDLQDEQIDPDELAHLGLVAPV